MYEVILIIILKIKIYILFLNLYLNIKLMIFRQQYKDLSIKSLIKKFIKNKNISSA